uniref:Ribosomal protein S7 n=1 Tax=Albidella oligococca TaxID=2890917 RepID=A0A1Z1V5N8_ALBOL|nr:ribosomal protein S7 [Albidella oligococca]
MISGKRRRVRAIFYETFHRLARSEGDVIELLVKAVENLKPLCEVEKVQIASQTYDVPSIVGRDRQQSLAIRWILEGAEEGRISKSTSLEKSSFEEIVDAYRQRGIAHMKRKNLHRLASVKRRFAHFRWPTRTGIKIFSWIATMWGGSIQFELQRARSNPFDTHGKNGRGKSFLSIRGGGISDDPKGPFSFDSPHSHSWELKDVVLPLLAPK